MLGARLRRPGLPKIAFGLLALVLIAGLVVVELQHNNCVKQTDAAIEVLEEARETHLPWIRHLGQSLPGAPEVGDISFHLKVVMQYNNALKALDSACSFMGA